ncbi:DnaJ domain-containing protein [Kaistia dalseonensis]|uniref:J domain-containing protein n=1 Tax=Kaistia dalseonensis TaxID=410840 RepID=A0ABU0H152_9HYPH|nr:DnaJ domain-containing protein [Kaistia dalseonensis]MCX5493479.1 DnaJ domain-containing protein [Kaistia dalseonensis]MDQ0436038.1 hypothetical protein [Kaistia dalseonensis]
MGLIIPLLGVFVVAIGLAWLFAGEKGPEALGRAVRRGGAWGLVAVGVGLSLAGRMAIGLPLLGLGVSMLKPQRLFEHKPVLDANRVLRGRFAGRTLDSLGRDELAALHADLAGAPRDRSILEAHLDRRMPGWREDVERDAAGRSRRATGAGTMTKEQAYQILGLAPGASEAEITAAYRRLMKGVHPDQGGSTFLAAQINQAKDRLLDGHR